MKNRYFIVDDTDGNIGVLVFDGDNEKADSLIMDMVCEHYDSEDCGLDNGFKIEDYHGKKQKITGFTVNEDGDSSDFVLHIGETWVYGPE